LASPRRRPYIGSGHRHHARSGWWLDQCLDLSGAGARPRQATVQFDHAGRHGAIIARRYWSAANLSARGGERRGPRAVHAGFEFCPRQSEYEFAGAIKGRPD